MTSITGKRKAPDALVEATKRLRIEKPSSPGPQLYSEDEDDFEYRSDEGNFSDQERNVETPSTPLSPSRKKFPSEFKTLKCTWEGCTKSFNRPIRLQNHIKTHTNERTFVCTYEDCDKAYFEDKHLQQHIKGSHTHERKYQCDWEGCTKSFLTSTRLRRHKDAHEGHERFRCTAYPPCNETFRKHQTLQRHIRSEHLELAPYQCNFVDPITRQPCNEGFDGAVGLRKHMNRAHGEPQFFCIECIIPYEYNADGSPRNRGFTSESLLQAHIRKEHVNNSCMFCDLKCNSRQTLQKHIDSQHSGTSLEQRKNVRCTYIGCGKTFTKKSNLTIHIRTAHLGERFVCGEYDTSTSTGLEAFNLEDGCEKDFVSKASLDDHIRTAHLGLPSLVNKNRVNTSSEGFEEVDEAEEEFDETEIINDEEHKLRPKSNKKNKQKRRGGKKAPSAIDQLLGKQSTTPASPASTQTRNNRQNPTFTNQDPDSMDLLPTVGLGWPVLPLQPTEQMSLDEPYPTTGNSNQELELQPTYHAIDADLDLDLEDWDLQRQALEGGAFWIGADDGEGTGVEPLGMDTWAQDELEMRRLIGANGDGDGYEESLYPPLE